MKNFKRITSLVLALVLSFAACAAVLPGEAAASGVVASGTCGDNLTWILYSTGTLTIQGTGKMENYFPGDAPWRDMSENVQKVTIANGVTTIGNFAFAYCDKLTSATIPSSVTSIGNFAFDGCYSLASVNIPDGVTAIGKSTFFGCISLTTISIPDGVTSIGYEAFRACTSLYFVSLPKSVTTIDELAFWECNSLSNVFYYGTQSDRNRITIDEYNAPLTGAAWYYGDGSQTYNPFADLSVNSTFEMGYYGGQTLRWRVLEKYSDKMLVLCEDGIDSRRYHYTKESVTWASCSLRTWLNDDFYYSAFSTSERSYILTTNVDSTYCKLYLLSTGEVMNYFPTKSSRICRATTYAVSEGAYVNSNTGGSWWLLRTPGDDYQHVASVNSDGSMDYAGGRVESDKGVVRPAMWISLA